VVVFQVFDPPMCCSTGICGPKVDPALTRFAADLGWLKSRGVVVQRFNLAREPDAFADTPAIQQMLGEVGPKCLPLILVDGRVLSQGVYPSREELAALAGIVAQQPANTSRVSSSFVHLTDPNHRSARPKEGGGSCRGSGCCG
jgi:hypothetical protein